MDDETLRAKYSVLYKNVFNIKSMLNDLDNIYDIFYDNLKDAITFDNEIPELKNMNALKKNVDDIKLEINEVVLPKISNKI